MPAPGTRKNLHKKTRNSHGDGDSFKTETPKEPLRTPLSAEELERVKAAFIRVDKDNSCTLDGLDERAAV